MTTVCCVCQKTRRHDRWVIESHARPQTLSHGYCPSCFRSVMQRLEGCAGRWDESDRQAEPQRGDVRGCGSW